MKILLCHNYYQQRGGEDESFQAEAAMLRAAGDDVLEYTVHSDSIRGMSRWQLATSTMWSRNTYRELKSLIRREKPAVMHCTNTFPLLSPSAYYAARSSGVAVVQSLRNYRLLCPNAVFYRDGRVCEDCASKWFAWPGIRHACYRESRSASAAVASLSAFHRLLGTWKNAVDLYFTPSEFARGKYIAAGFSPDQIAVKPNFVFPDPGPGPGDGGYAVFVGRLSHEKGLETLLTAWRQRPGPQRLKIIGDGALTELATGAAAADSRIEYCGRLPASEVIHVLGGAFCLIMPSVWYETFGRTMIEAFARGTPVIASRLGAMTEIVEDGRTGFLFEPGNAQALAERLDQLLMDPGRVAEMRRQARAAFKSRFAAEPNRRMLLELYRRAIEARNAKL